MAKYLEFSASPAKLLRAGEGFSLAGVDPSSTPGFPGKKRDGEATLAGADKKLAALQEKLFASSRVDGTKALLLVLQGMDTSGKGGIVSHVIGAVDPQGITHKAFKAPSEEELRHDFLWRIETELPQAGMMGVFDRSHYEDVLIHRVRKLAAMDEIERRYEAINAFEARLAGAGTKVIKVMLHIGKDTQKERLAARLRDERKYWKYNSGDLEERAYWDDYQQAYQTAIERTSTKESPWFVVPADKKWYARIAVQHLLVGALEGMGLRWPQPDFDVAAERAKVAAS